MFDEKLDKNELLKYKCLELACHRSWEKQDSKDTIEEAEKFYSYITSTSKDKYIDEEGNPVKLVS